MDQPIQIPYIKKDALIDIKLGSAFIGELQDILLFLTKDLKSEDIRNKVQDKQQLTEQEQGVITLSRLMTHIMQIAKTNDLIEYKNLEDTITL